MLPVALAVPVTNSTNGTCLNGEKIQPRRYVELRESDVLKFGNSSRDYVLLNEHSNKGAAAPSPDDDEDKMV